MSVADGTDTKRTVRDLVTRLKSPRILVVGDVMIDHDLFGQVDRVASEAPVPILRIEDQQWSLGGAGLVAQMCRRLGADVHVIGRAGEDQYGSWLRSGLADLNVGFTGFRMSPEYRTQAKVRGYTRRAGKLTQISRADYGNKALPPSDSELQLLSMADSFDLVLVCDHVTGFINRSVVEALAVGERPLIVDPGPGVPWREYDAATGIKCNEHETRFADRNIGPRFVVETRENCSIVRHNCGGSRHHSWSLPRKSVQRTIGAGDQVMAMLGVALGSGLELDDACWLSLFAAREYVSGRNVNQFQLLEAADE